MRMSIQVAMVTIGLSSLPVMAGVELGVLADKQFGKAQTVAAGVGVSNGNYESVSPNGYGFRAGVSLIDLKVAELGLTATYHPKAEGDLVLGATTLGKYGNEYVAIGAQVDWKFLINLHAGLDYRREKSTISGVPNFSGSVTNSRPWVKAGLGFSIPTPIVSPFFRFEVAVPVSNEENNSSKDDLQKALAPRYQLALYGGIRF